MDRASVAVLGGLSIEDKARLTAGASMWSTAAFPDAGIPTLKMADGPMGIASGRVDERDVALLTPSGVALGASWDPDLVARVGRLVGSEAIRWGVDLVLAPNVNLPRSPLAGRAFELFSEDPLLTGTLGAAWITGLQQTGTGAVVKHLVCNDSETERASMNSVVSEKALREVYLLPFELAAEAGAAGMLAAYNRVNGTYCAEHPHILSNIVKGEWRYPGLLVSDWFGTQSEASMTAGLSLEMPGPARHMGPHFATAVAAGAVDGALLEDAAERVARTATRWAAGKAERVPAAEASELLVEAAAAGFTLLKNEGGVLPLAPAEAHRIAVIGPNAVAPCFQGGTFAKIAVRPDASTPLEALRARYGDILFEKGVDPAPRLPSMPVTPARPAGDGATAGMTIEYFADPEMSGAPVAVETRDTNSLTWFAGMHELGVWDRPAAVRASGRFVPATTGRHLFYAGGTGSVRLLVNGRMVLEDTRSVAPGDVMGMLKAGDAREVAVELVSGEPVEVVVELRYGAARAQGLWYGIREPDDVEAMLQRAVAAAAEVDTVILIVGETSDAGVESKDRESTELDPLQVRLIREVTAANRRTIVVANVGHAFDTAWDGDAAALLLTWYAGEEFGQALADVLSGVREPGGRMPVTIAKSDADYPAFDLTPDPGGDLVYAEDTSVGYRAFAARGIAPRHALGTGFGYARFEFSALEAVLLPSGAVEVSVTVANVSARAGKEVVQVYRDEPELTLVGFAAVHLAAGEARRVALVLPPRRFMTWEQGWRWIGARATLRVGRSSVDLPLERTVPLPVAR